MRIMFPEASRARRTLTAAFACLCGALLFSSCSLDGASKKDVATETPRGTQAPRAALPMPPIESAHRTSEREGAWTMLDGRREGLADYRGQVVVLDFYATYCPPCREEIPHLVALQRHLGPHGLKVVGLNVGGAEDRDKVPDYVKSLGIQYQLANPDDELTSTLLADNDVIPQTFVFDRQGRLVEHLIGFDNEVSGRLEAAVQTALATTAD